MGVLSLDKVRELVSVSESPAISIYIPTHPAGPAARQDPIRLKNSLGLAEERLLADGRRRPDVEQLLKPPRALIDRPEFWRRQGGGLAVFLSEGTFEHLRFTLPFKELVLVGKRFHLKPLMPLLTGDGRFYILTLSQNKVRLLEASRDGARELDTPSIPSSLEEGVNMEGKQHHYFQKQLRDPHSTAERSEVFDAMMEPFLQGVDAAVCALLEEQRPPLLLAGVKRICTAYRLLSKYPAIVEECVEGNPEDLPQTELHSRAWTIVEPIFSADRQQAAARYRDLQSSPRAGHDIRPVLQAAQQGRVDTLFVPLEENVWGHFEPEDNLRIELTGTPDGEDLLDRAAIETLVRRGKVFAVPRGEMPAAGVVNAIYRY